MPACSRASTAVCIQDGSQSLSNFSRNSQRYCETKFFVFLFEMSDHGFRLRPCPKEGMNGLVSPLLVFDLLNLPLPPLPCLCPKLPSPWSLTSVFYFPKDILITTDFTLRPKSSATDLFVFLNIPLFLLSFCIFLFWLWQICASFYPHKYGACIHPKTSAGVNITFSVNI